MERLGNERSPTKWKRVQNYSATGCDTDRQVAYVFVKQVVFLTVNHRGPLPLRELHSTGEILVWRDPRGS